jgi:hypothetical protein
MPCSRPRRCLGSADVCLHAVPNLSVGASKRGRHSPHWCRSSRMPPVRTRLLLAKHCQSPWGYWSPCAVLALGTAGSRPHLQVCNTLRPLLNIPVHADATVWIADAAVNPHSKIVSSPHLCNSVFIFYLGFPIPAWRAGYSDGNVIQLTEHKYSYSGRWSGGSSGMVIFMDRCSRCCVINLLDFFLIYTHIYVHLWLRLFHILLHLHVCQTYIVCSKQYWSFIFQPIAV